MSETYSLRVDYRFMSDLHTLVAKLQMTRAKEVQDVEHEVMSMIKAGRTPGPALLAKQQEVHSRGKNVAVSNLIRVCAMEGFAAISKRPASEVLGLLSGDMVKTGRPRRR